MSDNRTGDILLDFKKSFFDDKRDLQNQIIEIETRIHEANDYIESLNKKEDCDYNMFSPRSASRVYKDQVYEKRIEIEDLEEKLRVLYKKLGNVTKKIDSLNQLNADDIDALKSAEQQNLLNDKSDDSETVPIISNAGVASTDNAAFLKLQEDDRQRIAADLHDSVLQNLSLVMHNLELAEKFIDYDSVRAKLELESNRKLVKETIEEIRSTIFDLRPMQFDDFGFKSSVENQLDTYKSRTNMYISYSIDDLEGVDHLILITVFRIVQELVINAIKHSEGSEVNVNIMDEGSKVYIEVSDNGIGLEANALNKSNHFGLKILRERVNIIGGTLKIPVVEKGFCVIIEIPISR